MLNEPADRLVVDQTPHPPAAGQAMVVIGSRELAEHALATGARVLAFCDTATEHSALPAGVEPITPDDPLPGLDLAWMRLPRGRDELDELAAWVAASGATLVAGGRTKHMTITMNSVLERHFDEVQATRGRNKSRVLQAHRAKPGTLTRWPRHRRLVIDSRPLIVSRHGGTFASGRLDPGTELLLTTLDEVVARSPGGARVLDWGCGAGVICAALSRRLGPEAAITGIDLSWAGAMAARETMAANHLGVTTAWGDANQWLDRAAPLDLIIANPPFHAGAAKDSSATEELISWAPQRLSTGGQLVLVFNSHLPWLTMMRRHGHTEILAQDRGYTVARLTVGWWTCA